MSGRQDEAGRAAVVRNGYQPERDIQTGIGPVTVKVYRSIRSRDGKLGEFSLGAGATVRAQKREPGSGAAVAVSEGDFYR